MSENKHEWQEKLDQASKLITEAVNEIQSSYKEKLSKEEENNLWRQKRYIYNAIINMKSLVYRYFPEEIPENLQEFSWGDFVEVLPVVNTNNKSKQNFEFTYQVRFGEKTTNRILLNSLKKENKDNDWINGALVVAHALSYYHDKFGITLEDDVALDERLRHLAKEGVVAIDNKDLPYGKYKVKLQ